MRDKILVREKDIIKTYSKQQEELALQYLRVIKLRKKFGWSKYVIAKRTGISIDRVKHWIYDDVKPVPIKIVEELETKNLLPLSVNNDSFDTFVELVAFVFGDGHLSRNFVVFSNKRKKNLIALEKKLNKLSFNGKYYKRINKNHVMPDRKLLTGASNDFKVPSSALVRMLIGLGCPSGNKTHKIFYVPKWLIKSNSETISKFLGVFYSNEGSTPCFRNNTLLGLRIKLSKSVEFRKEHEKFMNQLRLLFKKLNIKTSKVKWEPRYNRTKSDIVTQPAYFDISRSFENFLRLSSCLSISYDYKKRERIDHIRKIIIVKVLKCLKNCEKYDKAKELFDTGCSMRRISKDLEVNYKTLGYWLKSGTPSLYNERGDLQNLIKP